MKKTGRPKTLPPNTRGFYIRMTEEERQKVLELLRQLREKTQSPG